MAYLKAKARLLLLWRINPNEKFSLQHTLGPMSPLTKKSVWERNHAFDSIKCFSFTSLLSYCGVNPKIRRNDADLLLLGLTPQTLFIIGEQMSDPFPCMKAQPGRNDARRPPWLSPVTGAIFQWALVPLQELIHRRGILLACFRCLSGICSEVSCTFWPGSA